MGKNGIKWGEMGEGAERMPQYIGSYRHSIDAKGRLSLPAKFRSGDQESFILTRGLNRTIFVYPEEEWRKTIAKLTEIQRTRREARKLILNVTAFAAEVEIDRQGRISIPQSLLEWGELDREALVVGTIQKIEIWRPERFEAFVASPERPYDELAADLLY